MCLGWANRQGKGSEGVWRTSCGSLMFPLGAGAHHTGIWSRLAVFPPGGIHSLCSKTSLWTEPKSRVSYSPDSFPVRMEIALIWHIRQVKTALVPSVALPDLGGLGNFKQEISQPLQSLQCSCFHICLSSFLMGQLQALEVFHWAGGGPSQLSWGQEDVQCSSGIVKSNYNSETAASGSRKPSPATAHYVSLREVPLESSSKEAGWALNQLTYFLPLGVLQIFTGPDIHALPNPYIFKNSWTNKLGEHWAYEATLAVFQCLLGRS